MHALIVRKLRIDDENYYQMLDKVEAKEISEQYIRVLKGFHNFEGQDFVPIAHDKELGYLTIDDVINEKIDGNSTAFFKLDEEGFVIPIENTVERNNIILAFFNKYKDFKIIPDYDLDEIINKMEASMKASVVGQDDVIKKIISKIYNNQMYFKSDLDENIIRKNRSNILLVGQFGTGKTSIKESLLRVESPIPVVEVELTDSYSDDTAKIANALLNAAHGNVYLAQRGIVIFDDISASKSVFSKDENGANKENLNLKCLEKIIKSQKLNFPAYEGDSVLPFDFSFITFIAMVDTYFSPEEDIEMSYYQKMSIDSYYELGIKDSLLLDCFDNEIIYMNEMTKELAIRILKDKTLSPLYQYQKTMSEKFETIKFSKKFVDILIEYGLSTDEGFTGIKRFFKYAVEAKNRTSKNAIFDEKDIANLRIGSAGTGDYEEELDDMIPIKEIETPKDDILKVDVKKRTINGLSIKDVVEIITKEYKGQDEHIFRIVNAFYNHVLNRYKGFSADEYKKLKQNVFLIANTGVGKTGIFEALARIFNLPYKRDSINTYTASGYVGRSVDDLIVGLVASASGSVEKARFGILCLDEFDKLARDNGDMDFGFGRKVQEELLTLIEGDEKDIKPDLFANTFKFNSEYLFIVLTGACQDIDKVIQKRIKSSRNLGFENKKDEEIPREVIQEDLLNYGFEKQLLARVPNIIRLNDLTKEVLLEIIKSEAGYISLIKKSYLMSDIKINLAEGFMENLAIAAYNKKIGARGIRQIFEDKIIPKIDELIANYDISEINVLDNALIDPNDITYVEKKVKKKVKRR